MHRYSLVTALIIGANLFAQKPDGETVWSELKTKREKIPSIHQEFEGSQSNKNVYQSAAFKRHIEIDMSGQMWREKKGAHKYSTVKTSYLEIVGGAVDDDRAGVEEYLQKHKHSYPIVLEAENEMPLPYTVHVIPTYIVVDKDGVVAGAGEGDKGFASLRKMLEKAGLDVD